ncbi:MAG: FecR domain-containing protein [Deltaproteobacteria bacterium]|nr:FecR domain-containing protein [Deltaproteobacteria bacterium]
MRKKMLLVIVAAAMAAFSADAQGAGAKGETVGMVSLCEGAAQVVSGGTAREALAGDELYEGDTLLTGAGGKLKVLFRDDSLVTLSGNAKLDITGYRVDASKKLRTSVLTLVRGKVMSLVSRMYANPASGFEVKTKTAVAGVRGTRFVVETGEGPDRVATFEGTVLVSKSDGKGEVTVVAGNYAEVGTVAPSALAMNEDLRTRIAGDLMKVDKMPAYAMNMGTLSNKDLLASSEGVAEEGRGSYANGRTAKATARGVAPGSAAAGGEQGQPAADKVADTPAEAMGPQSESTPEPGGSRGSGESGDPTGYGGNPADNGGTGQVGTNGYKRLVVKIWLPQALGIKGKGR